MSCIKSKMRTVNWKRDFKSKIMEINNKKQANANKIIIRVYLNNNNLSSTNS